ncbi:hypothetical protein ALT_6932 [Aspergillus lentulus]|uniref:Uncharacterized protein n=1 Tax=Aspergillus lentulus TaxID=293939 RepID=A0AAN4PSR1_ASPLE|nr:uncharacterized protein IFM58399_05110 [Aspergillus lentulus]KAF4159791.1 hypothetical protein CNMCM6069_000870 [Aspergillus lentulus]KAF4169152.1 hypothetical protein CNMCM6936_009149 [Aspergillus lentulus]KAF4179983.1 hypothetical protein CNMCM8060_002207 [Aspergillus lentulus]KAF4186219.1 hypothetical protein CNMCM7927_005707 [Aspergillus lentulus]KAF4199678.1 hypothetical protein CNMCM8694_003427 [Aspergillus lentulus]
MVRDSPIEGYAIVPMEWTGKPHPDKPEVTFKGALQVASQPYSSTDNLQEVMTQIRDVNPEFVASPGQKNSGLSARNIEERNKVSHPISSPLNGRQIEEATGK